MKSLRRRKNYRIRNNVLSVEKDFAQPKRDHLMSMQDNSKKLPFSKCTKKHLLFRLMRIMR